MGVLAHVIQMATPADMARDELFAELKPHLDKSDLSPVGPDYLVAVYDRAGKKTKGGIIIADNNREDEFQGKVCLVLKVGPMCCEEHSPGFNAWFGGNPPKVGDWVGLKINDGWSVKLGETTCRFVEWKNLRFTTQAHDLVM